MDLRPKSERVRDWVEDNPGASALEIAAGVGLSVESVGNVLRHDGNGGYMDSDVVDGVHRYWLQGRPNKTGTSRVLFVAVERLLRGQGALTVAEIAAAIGRRYSVTHTTLTALERLGHVVCESHTRPFRYRWTLREP